MSYVSESKTEPPGTATLRLYQGSTAGTPAKIETFSGSRQQYGWRSGISEADMAKLQSFSSHSTWGDTPTLVQALERMEFATSGNPRKRAAESGIVHDRDYSEITVTNSACTFQYKDVGKSVYRNEAHLGVLSVSQMKWPSEDSLRAKAGDMLRDTAPTRPDMDLAVMLGELRQAHDLLLPRRKKLKVTPANPVKAGVKSDLKLTGNAYLWNMFGIQPTSSDIARLCEAVINMDDEFQKFVRNSGKLTRRSPEVLLKEDTYNATFSLANSTLDREIEMGPVVCRFAHRDGYVYRREPAFRVHVERRLRLRAFCTWEFFVGDPDGYISRREGYLEKAKHALGGGITAASLYALTPYSWLADWFVDLGSILEFQQQVADYSLTWRRSGFVAEETAAVSVTLIPKTGGTYTRVGCDGTAFARSKVQMRRGGSPYSLLPEIPTDPKQLAILAALGLTKLL